MPSSLRLSACLFAVTSALDLKKPTASLLEKKKPAVASLMESAKSFLKNGATPDVVEFADATLEEVSSIVIPAILNESESDQRFIYSLHSRFEVIRTALAQGNAEVAQLNSEEVAASGLHKTCRAEQAVACTNKRDCEMELYRLWTRWVTEEEELREIHGYISGHFCPPDANGTLHAFRVASVPWMQQYMAKKILVDEAEAEYDVYVPECVVTHNALDQKSATCDAHQTALEQKACAHASKITDVLTTYYNDFAQAQASYNCAVEEIMQLERDRKREWITLQVVNCLLGRVHELNGRPCDTETGEVDTEIAFCEQGHYVEVCNPDEGEPRLCLDYPPIPPCPQDCTSRDVVAQEPLCLPVVQHIPCSGEWEDQEYAGLPDVPVPPFHSEHPGCNAYPECSSCPDMPTPAPVFIDACPGYTVDGCIGSDAEAGEHPLTFVRDVDGVADVRCCSIDGESCQSQGFEGGVDFLAPNGQTHEQCYFDVTYQEAMGVCHDAGKRMCTVDEMQTCCNTGCWHNHHAIWVDIGNAHVDTRPEWTVVQGAATSAHPDVNVGADAFNAMFAACPVVRYTNPSMTGSPAIYKRHSSAAAYPGDAHALFTYLWAQADNAFHTDFDIYSSMADVRDGTNPWQFCNFADQPQPNHFTVGFPRDCGPAVYQPHIWFHATRTSGLQTQGFFEIYTGANCPSA